MIRAGQIIPERLAQTWTWLAPAPDTVLAERSCAACEVTQRTTGHEPCWCCGGPTVLGSAALWQAVVPAW